MENKKNTLLWPPIERIKKNIILASSSPRRAAIFKQLGIPFKQVPSQINEKELAEENPLDRVKRLAKEKAQSVFSENPECIVIGSDTVVVAKDIILEKPKDVNEARIMLLQLSGREHSVCSGIAIATKGEIYAATDTTRVFFRPIKSEEMEWYLHTKEPLDKAGAYAIQGKGSVFIERIEGCYYNVVGFPLSRFVTLLEEVKVS